MFDLTEAEWSRESIFVKRRIDGTVSGRGLRPFASFGERSKTV